MGDIEKICILCGVSCAGQPRIKDEKGRYAHQACVDARQTAASTADGPDDGLDDGFNDAFLDEDMLVAELPENLDASPEPAPTGAAACAGCGQRLDEGAIVCMHCGYNAQSGKRLATSAREAKSGAMSAALSSKVGGLAGSPMLPFIGALIGGAIGAAVWAAISYFLEVEIGWIAWGIGALVGFGATIGPMEGSGGGAITGAMAALVAMGSIAGGKYAASYFAVRDYIGSGSASVSAGNIDDDWAMSWIVDEIHDEHIQSGLPVKWPDPRMSVDEAEWPGDYPQDLQDETIARWDSMNERDRGEYKDYMVATVGSFSQTLTRESFIQSFMHPFDLIFMFLAVITAYKIASNEG